MPLNRRDFIRRLIGGGIGIALAPSVLLGPSAAMTYSPYTEVVFHFTDDELIRNTALAARYIDAAVQALSEKIDADLFELYRSHYL